MGFHLLERLPARAEFRLPIGHRPMEGLANRDGNGALRRAPGVIGDVADDIDLGLGK